MAAMPSHAAYVGIIVKSVLGGLLIAALLSLARMRQYVITGLLVSMPVISLYTWWWVGAEQGAEPLRIAVRAAMFSAIPWVAYLGVVYMLAGRAPLWLGLSAGWLAWLVISGIVWAMLQGRA